MGLLRCAMNLFIPAKVIYLRLFAFLWNLLELR